MELHGKVVLVTGAARRIGREIAKGFSERGARVILHYHTSKKEALRLRDEIRGEGGSCEAYQADLRRTPEILKLARRVLKKFGRVDVLVNNASVFFPTPLGKITEAHWDELTTVNLKAPFFLSQALGVAMKKRGCGRIINISDSSALRPTSGYLAYCISKGGLLRLTEGFARELAPQVLVNSICPGPILPPSFLGENGNKKKYGKMSLVGRLGSPQEVVKTVLLLSESDFVTGGTYLVDGGKLLAN